MKTAVWVGRAGKPRQQMAATGGRRAPREGRLSFEAWVTLRTAVFERDGWRCVTCKKYRGLDAHHILPRSQGGEDVLTNLVALCRGCHDQMDGGGWKRVRVDYEAYTRGKAADGWRG